MNRGQYLEFLSKAKARGFTFVLFRDFLPGGPALPARYIALRHDVDFAPAYAADMAEIEHAAGVVSTFHVLVDGRFYNPLDRATIGCLRRIHALGHEIGLHFAASGAVYADLGEEVAFRIRILRELIGAPVRSFSQHDVVNEGAVAVALPAAHEVCLNVRDVIEQHHLLYVSDSAKMWRKFTFATALDQDRNLCLLAHPHSWLHPEQDYVALISDLKSREVQAVADRFDAFIDALPGYYARRRREEI